MVVAAEVSVVLDELVLDELVLESLGSGMVVGGWLTLDSLVLEELVLDTIGTATVVTTLVSLVVKELAMSTELAELVAVAGATQEHAEETLAALQGGKMNVGSGSGLLGITV